MASATVRTACVWIGRLSVLECALAVDQDARLGPRIGLLRLCAHWSITGSVTGFVTGKVPVTVLRAEIARNTMCMHCMQIVLRAEIARNTVTGTLPVTGTVTLPVFLQCTYPNLLWHLVRRVGLSHPQSARAKSVGKPPFYTYTILDTIFLQVMCIQSSHRV